MIRDESLSSTTMPANNAEMGGESQCQALVESVAGAQKSATRVFQAHDRPISIRCAKIWEMISETPKAARMVSIVFVTLLPTVHETLFKVIFYFNLKF